jgi:hypothetical protein
MMLKCITNLALNLRRRGNKAKVQAHLFMGDDQAAAV